MPVNGHNYYPYLAPGEYTRGKRFFTVNPARRVFAAG